MAPSSFRFIKLPAVRAAQFKRLAKIRHTTMSALIGETIERAVAKGELPDETPGIQFAGYGADGLIVRIDDEHVVMTSYEAMQFHRLLQGRSKRAWHCSKGRKILTVRRAGTGISLEIVGGTRAAHKSLPTKMAIDLCRQIEKVTNTSAWSRFHSVDAEK